MMCLIKCNWSAVGVGQYLGESAKPREQPAASVSVVCPCGAATWGIREETNAESRLYSPRMVGSGGENVYANSSSFQIIAREMHDEQPDL